MVKREEKRGQKRRKVNLPVTYVYSDERDPHLNKGITFDLCNTGMSFYTNKPLKEGLALQIQSFIWDSPKPCVIKWRSKKSRSIYKVGVFFR